ncbi:LAGLIDADG family homing endonuclease [Neobacillus terrae]|uniref:LAGLIDADG family homing endonuclease n=1 Tax=Neobacillus terrae TaxID=3034837 RepID=UPI00140DAB43|nr:LAGLIDADG family homing endonuclease [Neobacillus terrae]NHM33852.1 hypothetical protein [Neobacillus terrae]
MENWEAAYVAGIIDGEGSIHLTRMHNSEFRRPYISVASTDKELLIYIQSLTDGLITNKKNYKPHKHKNSFTLSIKKKENVFNILRCILPYLRVEQKKKRAQWILNNYNQVTSRNGKYAPELLKEKLLFEEIFFKL